MKRIGLIIVGIVIGAVGTLGQSKDDFTAEMMQDKCTFETTGENTYFVLKPGYQLTLEDSKGGRLVITVLYETKKIGSTETRVVEESESSNGKTVEISRNYFAYCKENSGIYYFGEQTDIYKDGKVVAHEGSWEATGNNKAGLAMPGLPLLGARYYQEIAPGVAMDRAEVMSTSETLQTHAGEFSKCLRTLETTPIERNEKEYKIYAPGIGLIKDEDMVLKNFGLIEPPVQMKKKDQ